MAYDPKDKQSIESNPYTASANRNTPFTLDLLAKYKVRAQDSVETEPTNKDLHLIRATIYNAALILAKLLAQQEEDR